MASEMKAITKKQLSKQLAEKHRRFLAEQGKEYDQIHKLFVLREKQDQLEHWISDAESDDDAKKLKEYQKQKKKNDAEMNKLAADLGELNSDLRQRYNLLKQRIDSHKAAIDYWGAFDKNE